MLDTNIVSNLVRNPQFIWKIPQRKKLIKQSLMLQ